MLTEMNKEIKFVISKWSNLSKVLDKYKEGITFEDLQKIVKFSELLKIMEPLNVSMVFETDEFMEFDEEEAFLSIMSMADLTETLEIGDPTEALAGIYLRRAVRLVEELIKKHISLLEELKIYLEIFDSNVGLVTEIKEESKKTLKREIDFFEVFNEGIKI